MKDKFKDSKVKEEQRELLFNRVTKSTNNKLTPEMLVGFTLPSSAAALESHFADFAEKRKTLVKLICAEDNKEHFIEAAQKLEKLKNNYFNSLICKKEDNLLFKQLGKIDPSVLNNKLDFAWPDWCGSLSPKKIETVRMISRFMKDGGHLAITVARKRTEMPEMVEYIKQFGIDKLNVSETMKRVYAIPCILNLELGNMQVPDKKGLKLLDVWLYSTTFGEDRVGVTYMIFYIFKVEPRVWKHTSYQLKKDVSTKIRKITCHNDEISEVRESHGLTWLEPRNKNEQNITTTLLK